MANKKFLNPINLVNLSSDPSTASEGDIYYNTTDDVVKVYANGTWVAIGAGGGSEITVSTTAPASPTVGDAWYKNDTGEFYVYDGTYWVEVNGVIEGTNTFNTISVSGQSDVVADSSTDTLTLVAGTNVSITTNATNDSITINADSKATSSVYLVRNNTGSTILKGTLVSASGAEPSGRIDVEPFAAVGGINSELTVMGMATTNISNGVNGEVISFGTLTGLDTRGDTTSAIAVGDETWAAGDILFAHPTVAGKLTKVRPQHDLAVAFITVRHASTGQIAVRIVPGNNHLEWMHDVLISSVAEDQVLRYDDATGLWKNTHPNIITAKNAEESTVSAFTPVFINSETLGLSQVTFLKADANVLSKMPATGITTESVTSEEFSKIVTQGVVTGITLTGYSDGDLLYVANGGGFTKTRPTGDDEIQPFGKVISVDNGTIYVLGNTFSSSINTLPNLTSDKIWLGTSGRPVETTLNTSIVPEGTNLYFTDERAQDAASAMITGGIHTGISVEHVDPSGIFNFTNTGVTAIYGTPNQISLTGGPTGSITLSIPNSPVFVTPNIGVATATSLVVGEATVKTTTTTITSSSATTIASIPTGLGLVVAECVVLLSSMIDGSYYTSKILIIGGNTNEGSTADFTEYAVIEDGSMNVTFTANLSGENVLLRAAVTNSGVTAKVVLTSISAENGAT